MMILTLLKVKRVISVMMSYTPRRSRPSSQGDSLTVEEVQLSPSNDRLQSLIIGLSSLPQIESLFHWIMLNMMLYQKFLK